MAQINQYLDGARVTFPTPFLPTGQAPLDIRQIVESKSELNIDSFKHNGNPYWYQGMLVSCLEDHKVYILKKKDDDYVFEEVTPDLPENATKNTTYDLASVANTEKGQIQLSNSDDTSVDTVSIEGDGSNIKVSSTASGVKVEHIAATSGDALTSSETLTPGYSGTFTAVTGLTKDANGHIVAAELKTITLPGEQTIPAETFTGVQVEGVDLTIANTKVNWGLNYNSSNKHIEVVDRNNSNAVMDYIDASDFIKDGMLSSGELVWCTIAADGKHTEVAEGTAGAVHCLKLTLRVWEHGLVDENGQPIYTEQYVHIPLGELCDPYAGTTGEIDVVEEHGQHVISLATKTVSETTGTALTPAHGGSFNVVTDVTYDTKGRIAGVETTQVTLPECAEIGDGTQTGSDDYVSVTVSTTGGVVSEVTVNTDSLTEKIEEIETVTSAALNDLNVRVSGIEAEYVKAVTSEEEALNNSSYVSVHAATEDGRVTLTSTVEAVDATDTTKYPSTGLATDGYVKEQIASVSAVSGTAVQNIKSEGQTITVERQAGSNDVNLELMWASF